MLAVWKVRLLGGSGELEARALAWEITHQRPLRSRRGHRRRTQR
jgi:hypothetical protein